MKLFQPGQVGFIVLSDIRNRDPIATQIDWLRLVTTESAGIYTPDEQMAVGRELKPAAASVALGELAPTESRLEEALRFFHWAGHAGVALQFIVYSVEQAKKLLCLARQGNWGTDRPHVLFVLGRHAVGQQSDPRSLVDFLALWPLTCRGVFAPLDVPKVNQWRRR